MPLDFNKLLEDDVSDVFLQEFSQTAIFKSSNSLKEVKVQFFESSLDGMDTTFFHAWCSYDEVKEVNKNDTIEIDGQVFGIMDFSPDELQKGTNIFLQKV